MIARRTHLPVVVDKNRANAVRHLYESFDCDIVISDDGLQHYALARDIEIAVVDGSRGLGNGLCFPAGPLREPPSRLAEVDLVGVKGESSMHFGVREVRMELEADCWVNLRNQIELALGDWQGGTRVHAIAAIGNPDRFFKSLEQLGLEVIQHPYADHRFFQVEDLLFDDHLPVVMTEKDAVKCRLLSPDLIHYNYWYLRIKTTVNTELAGIIQEQLVAKSGSRRVREAV